VPRSGWIAIGATVGALALPGAGRPAAALLLALAGLLLVALPRLTRRRRVAALAAMLGAATVALRLAIGGPPAGLAGEVGPDGTGPWTMVVETVGAPREGRQVATLRSVGHGVAGPRLAATLPRYPSVEPGDTVVVEGRARPRPDTPYGDYLERIGAWGTLQARRLEVASVPGADAGRTLERLRRGAGDVLAAVLPEPEAGLAAGILIGLRDRVDRDVAAAFTTAGVSHVVAISGWNIAIVAAAVAALAGRIDRRRRAVVTAAAIAVYIVFAGASPSVLRAGAMAGVVLLARESGRAGLAAAALGWAAALLLVAEPGLVSDAGFQLSTLATAGLIVWASPLTERIDRWTRGGLPRWLSESLGVSLAAQAATLPVVLASFGRLAVIAPVVNLLVVPLVAPVMVAGVVAFAGGLLVVLGAPGGLGAILAAPGWVGLRLMVGIVETAAVVPFASVSVPPSVAVPMAAMLVGVAAIVRLASRRWRARPRGGGSAIAASAGVASNRRYDNVSASTRRADRGTLTARRVSVGLLVVTVGLTGAVVVSRPAGVARIAVLDVGQGDAILVEGARSGRLLVDGGPDPDRLLIELDRRIPPWDRRIDAVVLTHPHEDHVAGLVLLLDRYRVETVFEPGMRGPGPGYAAWQARLARPDGPRRLGLAAGDRLRVDDIAIRVLWPDRGDVPTEPPSDGSMINRVSIVLLGTVADHRFLLTGDIEEDVDPVLLSRGLPKIDVLKIAHHGSRTATTEPFVAATRPAIAIASTGAENTYGHPARATLDRLTAVGARVYRTDLDGTVTATFDAAGIGVRRQPRANAADAAGPAVGEGGSLRYHRRDDGPFADGRRRPAVLPGPAGLARQARARRGRGRRVPRAADRRTRDPAGPTRGRGSRPAPRRRQDPARGRSCPRAPPWGGIRGLARPARSSRARPDRRRPSGLAPARWRDPAPLGRVREPRGARRGLRGQARPTADRLDG
jgi:competence protein ComEC